MPPDGQQLHRSFLLRLWRAGNGDAPQWRISLEDAQTHERHGFVDLDGLVLFLEEQIDRTLHQPADPDSNQPANQ